MDAAKDWKKSTDLTWLKKQADVINSKIQPVKDAVSAHEQRLAQEAQAAAVQFSYQTSSTANSLKRQHLYEPGLHGKCFRISANPTSRQRIHLHALHHMRRRWMEPACPMPGSHRPGRPSRNADFRRARRLTSHRRTQQHGRRVDRTTAARPDPLHTGPCNRCGTTRRLTPSTTVASEPICRPVTKTAIR